MKAPVKPTNVVLNPDHFRVLCAWCQSEIRPARIHLHGTPPPESHGICTPCAVKLGMPAERCVA